jgi:hypothetical protein
MQSVITVLGFTDALRAVTPAVARIQFCHIRILGMELVPLVQDEDKDREELLTAAVLLLR